MRKVFIMKSLLLMLLFSLGGAQYQYLREPPVKFLSVESVAKRFPATESAFRTSLTGGTVRDPEKAQFHCQICLRIVIDHCRTFPSVVATAISRIRSFCYCLAV